MTGEIDGGSRQGAVDGGVLGTAGEGTRVDSRVTPPPPPPPLHWCDIDRLLRRNDHDALPPSVILDWARHRGCGPSLPRTEPTEPNPTARHRGDLFFAVRQILIQGIGVLFKFRFWMLFKSLAQITKETRNNLSLA